MDQYLWIFMLIYICQQLLKGIGSLSLGSWIYKTNVPVWDMWYGVWISTSACAYGIVLALEQIFSITPPVLTIACLTDMWSSLPWSLEFSGMARQPKNMSVQVQYRYWHWMSDFSQNFYMRAIVIGCSIDLSCTISWYIEMVFKVHIEWK